MRSVLKICLVVAFVTMAFAQTQEPPLTDTRLTVHTLVREDIFAGFLADDMKRFSRGEKNIDWLLEKRPAEKSNLLAWKGGANLYRAVAAHEKKQPDEFQKYYKQALDYFAQARQISPEDDGVSAVTGGSYVIFADRLPKELRATAWTEAYNAYQKLWKHQAPALAHLPVHIRGELLGGLAQSAQRTGHTEELAQYLDKIQSVLSDTPYASVAKQWKENPKAASSASMTCLTCHEGGRLTARLNSLNGK
jgi:hypothetical protein